MTDYTNRQIEIMEAATNRIDQHGIQNLTIKNLAADIGISEPAIYRHFKSKNEILLNLLEYLRIEIKGRLKNIKDSPNISAGDELRQVFSAQLGSFESNPAIVSVIFAESIFHFEEKLSSKVLEIMNLMQKYVIENIENGQTRGQYSKVIKPNTLTTLIVGGMRMTVLKWKVSGHKSNLVKDGNSVLEGLLKLIEK